MKPANELVNREPLDDRALYWHTVCKTEPDDKLWVTIFAVANLKPVKKTKDGE